MNAALGTAGVSLGFLASLAGIVTVALGLGRRRPALLLQARLWVGLVLVGALVAAVVMEVALVTHDFSLTYVAENHSRSTPLLYTVASLWAALEGSIILWSLVLAGFLAAMVWHFRDRATDPMVGWAVLVGLVTAAFFFGLMMGPADPFGEVAGAVPADGPGPNPLLQNHPLMAFHPPMLYLGYVGFTIPYAFSVAALATGRLGEGWLVETRRWTLLAWGFLTAGIVLGAWWSYEVLGWGGFWAWDPVENASILPWLTATAYLHSVMMQERRGMLRVWNLSLVAATFALTILGTFLTRSGVLDSVHAFTNSTIGPLILGAFTVIVLVTVGLVGWRGDRLRSPGRIDSPLSREASFLANNVVFGAFAFVVLLGTVFPLVVEAINGDRISVGRPFFDTMAIPLGLLLLFLMAVAPVLPWRKASAELLSQRLFWPSWAGAAGAVIPVVMGRRGLAPIAAFGLGGFAAGAALRQVVLAGRRQGWRGLVGRANGGMIVHVGVVMIAMALAASGSYSHSAEVRLAPGESAHLAGHTVTYLGTETRETDQKTVTAARVQVDDDGVYEPSLNQFPFATQAIGTPAVRTSFVDDVYLTLVAPPGDGDEVVIGIVVQPMVAWLWAGGSVMVVGTALAAFPGGRRRPTAPVSEPAADRREGDGKVPARVPAGVR